MSAINFYKYQGTGNDFILVDNRTGDVTLNAGQISKLCDRRFGIGSDGLMLIQKATEPGLDFYLEFFNPDGSKSFCGNGSRCAVAFASYLKICNGSTQFKAVDGIHSATINDEGRVSLKMSDVGAIRNFRDGFFLNTGSPHVVLEVQDLKTYPVVKEGAEIRYSAEFNPSGTNVNFVERKGDNHFEVRTYERGVENETLSCGTGVTAVAVALHKKYQLTHDEVKITTQGGDLVVKVEPYNYGYRNIYLNGPTSFVFNGQVSPN
ncbi:MAG: diaminopimelate epimerase [Bacteroidota bacterium]